MASWKSLVQTPGAAATWWSAWIKSVTIPCGVLSQMSQQVPAKSIGTSSPSWKQAGPIWPPRPLIQVDAEIVSTQRLPAGQDSDGHGSECQVTPQSHLLPLLKVSSCTTQDGILSSSFLLGIRKILWSTGRNITECDFLHAQMSKPTEIQKLMVRDIPSLQGYRFWMLLIQGLGFGPGFLPRLPQGWVWNPTGCTKVLLYLHPHRLRSRGPTFTTTEVSAALVVGNM